MKQILFVLKKGQIAFWKYSRGSLSHGTLNGNRWNDFTPSYWEEWSEANQAGDSVDAILLADEPNAFGTLPDWLQERSDASAWTAVLLGKLANDTQFIGKGLVLSQGEAKFTLADGDAPECYSLTSSLKFTLPKEEPKKEVVKVEPPKVVKPTVVVDCYVDEKSRLIKEGDVVQGKVKAFSPWRGCYIESPAASDLFCIKPEEVEKCKEFAETLKGIGNAFAMTVVSLGECDNKIKMSVTFG